MVTSQTEAVGLDIPKRNPFLFILSIAAIVLMVAVALYLHLQKTAITDEQNRLDDEMKVLKTEITSLEDQKIESAQMAQEWLTSLQKEEIRWSDVLGKISALIPEDDAGEDKITFLSYSGSAGGKLSLNAQTQSAPVELFNDVADLIAVFNASSFFSHAYVPTISRGETETGDKILSFTFNLLYKEKLPEEIVTEADKVEKEKVPRQ